MGWAGHGHYGRRGPVVRSLKGRDRMYARYVVIPGLLVLSACGGGGGGDDLSGGGSGGGGSGSSGWIAGVYQPASNFAGRCTAPRSGTNDLAGTTTDENNWLRSWINDTYLWYSEVPDLNPALYTSTLDYFDLLKTSAKTLSGNDKDRFHFTEDTAAWIASSQGGQSVGYGFDLSLVGQTPPRTATIAFVQADTPASAPAANLSRGERIITVDNVSINDGTQAGVDVLNAALFPSNAGESHTFVLQELDGFTTRTVTLTTVTVTEDPVPVVNVVSSPTGAKVGYILFNSHNSPSEGRLVTAINTLKAKAIDDLVLDIRYNGGGYLDIAAELAYMIAGPARTSGQTFERTMFNSKYPTTDPVTRSPIVPTGFWSTASGLPGALPEGTVLPTLNLSRVFVLTGSGTCSASESIINGLRGVDVDVIQIGTTTCGKPYGFYPTDNCGTTYFSIQFQGVNNKGFGDYPDGFSPSNPQTNQAQLPGCSVADDFTHELGDVAENRLESALAYRDLQSCIALATFDPQAVGAASTPATEGVILPRSTWQTNRILRQR